MKTFRILITLAIFHLFAFAAKGENRIALRQTEVAAREEFMRELQLDVDSDSVWIAGERSRILQYYQRIRDMQQQSSQEGMHNTRDMLWRTCYFIMILTAFVIILSMFYVHRAKMFNRRLKSKHKRLEIAKDKAEQRDAFGKEVMRKLAVNISQSCDGVEQALHADDPQRLGKAVKKFTEMINDAMNYVEHGAGVVIVALLLLRCGLPASAQNNRYGIRDDLFELHSRCDLIVAQESVLPLADSLFNLGWQYGDTLACCLAWDIRMGNSYFTQDVNRMRKTLDGVSKFIEGCSYKRYLFFAWNRIVLYYLNNGDYLSALAETDRYRNQALAMSEPYGISRGYFYMGEICRQTGLYNEAVSEYRHGLDYIMQLDRKELESADLYSRLADTYIELGQFDEAAECLRLTLVFAKRDSHRVTGYSSLLKLYVRQGNKEKAQEMETILSTFNAADRLTPNDRRMLDFYEAMLLYHAMMGNRKEAAAYVEKLGTSRPKAQMEASAMLGDYQNALKMLQLYKQEKARGRCLLSAENMARSIESFESDLATRSIEINKTELGLRYMRIVRWGLSLFLALVLGSFVVFVIFHMRNRRRMEDANARTMEAFRQLDLANQRKRRFIHMLTHELRTPLNVVYGFNQVIHDATPDESQRMLPTIHENMTNLKSMAKSVGQVNELFYEEVPFNFTKVNLRRLCDEVSAEALQINLGKPAVQFKSAPFRGPETLVTDGRRLHDVLLILLENAFKFTSEGQVSFSCNQVKDGVAFCVEDTGVGVPPDKIETLFDGFMKVNEYVPGLGLGLTISRLSVQKLGGTIYVDTLYAGPGTRIVVKLPNNN